MSLHELLEDDKRRQAADTAAVKCKQAELLTWHSWKAVAAFAIVGRGSRRRVKLAVEKERLIQTGTYIDSAEGRPCILR